MKNKDGSALHDSSLSKRYFLDFNLVYIYCKFSQIINIFMPAKCIPYVALCRCGIFVNAYSISN